MHVEWLIDRCYCSAVVIHPRAVPLGSVSRFAVDLCTTPHRSSDTTAVSCELCHVKCGTAQALLRHLQSKAHKYEEKLALEGTPTL